MSGFLSPGLLTADLDNSQAAQDATLAAGGGSARVGHQDSGAGSVARPLRTKLEERRSAGDFGGAGTGAGDDAASILAADAAAGKLKEYAATSFAPLYARDVLPDGVAHNRTTGRVYNPQAHRHWPAFGKETLQHWYGLFRGDSDTVNSGGGLIKKLVLSGDSTMFGYGNNPWGVPSKILGYLAPLLGFKNVQVINRGQSGKSMRQYVTEGYLEGDLALNPDLLVLRWGDNDFGQGRTLEQLLADTKSALTTIRASKDVDQLSVVLCVPTSMNDVENNRTQYNLETLVQPLKQLAREFKCASLDCYSILQDSHNAAGRWMDLDHGRAIHPGDVMQEHLQQALAELIFSPGVDWVNNGVRNHSAASTDTIRNLTDLPATFFDGVTLCRFAPSAGNALGTPFDGWALTIKQADSAVVQWIFPLPGATAGLGVTCRLGFNNVWSTVMLGGRVSGAGLLQNGFTNAPGGSPGLQYWWAFDGTLHLAGMVGAGTLTDGTVVFTLPAGYRPAANQIAVIGTANGFARIEVRSDGQVRLYGGAGAGSYLSFAGVEILP